MYRLKKEKLNLFIYFLIGQILANHKILLDSTQDSSL